MSLLRRRAMMEHLKDDYIKKGLIHRWVSRDSDGVIWIDRINQKQFDLVNVSKSGIELVFNGKNSYGICDYEDIGTDSTLEVVGRINKFGSTFACLYNQNGVCYNQNGEVLIAQNGSYVYENLDTGNKTISVTGGTNSLCVQNCSELTEIRSDFLYQLERKWYIGKRNGEAYNDFFLDGSIIELRIYSRRLSKDEMIHNQKIDLKKYF